MKTCFSCKQEKPLKEFYKAKDKAGKKQNECKECCRIRRSKWWKSDAGKKSSANSKLKARFGITLEEYWVMSEKQENRCLICSKHQDELEHKLAVDHCHTTGKIRGLLCKMCNVGLGNFKEDPRLLANAISYIDRVNKEIRFIYGRVTS